MDKEKDTYSGLNFEKQFGKGVDPWYAKAERLVKKKFKNPYLQHLALGFLAWLKKIWIEGKIQMEMASVDVQIKKLHEEWDEEEKKQFAPEIIETPSEVKGLKDMSIEAYREAAKADAWLFGDYDAYEAYDINKKKTSDTDDNP